MAQVIACDLESAKLFFPLKLAALAARCCGDTVAVELLACGAAACLAAARAPESEVSAGVETWSYELTF